MSTTGWFCRVVKNTFRDVMEDLKDCFMQINMYEESTFVKGFHVFIFSHELHSTSSVFKLGITFLLFVRNHD